MIKATREQFLVSEKGLTILAKAQLPIGLAYRVNRIIKQVADLLNETESVRQEILDKYGERQEDGTLKVDESTGFIQVAEDQREAFTEEITILFAEHCEITGDPIDINLLSAVSMSPQEIGSIEPFLTM